MTAASADRPRLGLWLGTAVAGLAALAAGLYLGGLLTPAPQPQAPTIGGDFTLQSAEGPVSLADFRGKVVPIYFGFASCPDICPTNLALMGGAIRQLDAGERAQVQPIFITLDPERDPPERAGEYAAYFHPSFLGLSGSREEIADVARRYAVAWVKVEDPESAMGYTIDHSSRTYLVGRDGKLVALIGHGAPAASIAADIRKALAEQ